jgi:hypothetical protein
MRESQPAGRAADVTVSPFRVAPAAVAVGVGALGLVLLAAWVVLTFLTRDLQVSRDGAASLFVVACGLLGMLVARRQPDNPEGWLLLCLAVAGLGLVDCGLYAVLDYHLHHGRLPLGALAVVLRGTIGPPLIFLFALVILLFPDGRLTRRWKWVLWAYLVVVVTVTAGFVASEAGTVAGRRIWVDMNGSYSGPGGPTGFLGAFAAVTGLGFILIPLFWPAFVARQAVSWRRATGDRCQQLKWLTSGAISALAGLALIALGPPNDQLSGRVARDAAFLALAVLPVTIGVGILKYHLYDIDRIISRTLAYLVMTSLLVGVYAGVVLLATRVLPLSSPVAVGGATLAAAALFSPLRRRVQRIVDRRFNRARYNADQIIAAFASQLQDGVDLDSVREHLAGAVRQALEPAHVSVWMSERR